MPSSHCHMNPSFPEFRKHLFWSTALPRPVLRRPLHAHFATHTACLGSSPLLSQEVFTVLLPALPGSVPSPFQAFARLSYCHFPPCTLRYPSRPCYAVLYTPFPRFSSAHSLSLSPPALPVLLPSHFATLPSRPLSRSILPFLPASLASSCPVSLWLPLCPSPVTQNITFT